MEDSLKEFEQRLSELKCRTEGPRSDKISNQELLKLQVKWIPFCESKCSLYLLLVPSTQRLTQCACAKDTYEELVLMVGSRRSSLNHGLSLKAQYEAALRDLSDLVDTAQDKMAADQKMTVVSVIEVQMLLDKHKVRNVGRRGWKP